MLSKRKITRKRYRYKGREISRAKANAMTVGAFAGMIGAGFALWILMVFLSALFSAAGGMA